MPANINSVVLLSSFYLISKHENFIPKSDLDNSLIDFAQTARTSRQLFEGKAPMLDFGEKNLPALRNVG